MCNDRMTWAARYDAWLLIKLPQEGVVFSCLANDRTMCLIQTRLDIDWWNITWM